MFKFAMIIFPAGDADGNDVGIVRVMEKSVCVMYGSVYRILFDCLEVRLVFICPVGYLPRGIKLDKTAFMAFVLN